MGCEVQCRPPFIVDPISPKFATQVHLQRPLHRRKVVTTCRLKKLLLEECVVGDHLHF
jgi:hypothetical protein